MDLFLPYGIGSIKGSYVNNEDGQIELLRNSYKTTIWYIKLYNRVMNNKQLKSFCNDQVLMNESAANDPVVRLALDAMSKIYF